MDMHQAFEIFLQEAAEHLQALENVLVARTRDARDPEGIDALFRALHTLKGSGSMFGLRRFTQLSHKAESVFDGIRSGRISMDENLVSLALEVKDELGALLQDCTPPDASGMVQAREGTGDEERFAALVMALESLLPQERKGTAPDRRSPAEGGSEPDISASPSTAVQVWQVSFRPDMHLVRNGTNPLLLIQELSELGRLECQADTSRIPCLEDLDPLDFHISWEFLVAGAVDGDRLRDTFIFVDDGTNIKVELVRQGPARSGEESVREGGAIPASADVPDNRLQAVPDRKPGAVHLPDTGRAASWIRVHAHKLQELLDAVGEMAVFQEKARSIVRGPADRAQEALGAALGELEGLVRRMGNLAVEMNMVAIGTIFSGYQRLVRDLSHSLDKKVRLVLTGTETELDKSIAEGLKDPLLHLIRNALDHGLETPARRTAAGKDPTGTLHIGASHSGGSVVIRIEDDGHGLDLPSIQARGIERGLLAPDSHPSRDDLVNLIFQPGFSTAPTVSDVSGRGVGMDVVRQGVESLRGTIRLETSEGKGSCITLTIPLTLALVDVLVTITGDLHHAFILEDIAEIVKLSDCPVIQENPRKGTRMVSWRGRALHCTDLERYHATAGTRGNRKEYGPDTCLVVLCQEDRHTGIIVDDVVENSQGMIKPLDSVLRKAPGISGSLLFGEGHVAWVVNSAWFFAGIARQE